MCEGLSINNTMDLYDTANYSKMQDLKVFFTKEPCSLQLQLTFMFK